MRTDTNELRKSIAAGAMAGMIGSLAMNQFQSAMSAVSQSVAKKERERKGKPEPQTAGGGDDATVTTANALSVAIFDHQLTEDEKKWAGPAVHYGFGTTLGALYGSLAPCTPVQAGAGTTFGAAVWLIADEVAVPSFGLSGPPNETPFAGHVKALASHLVFGLVVHLTRKLILS